MFVCFSWSTLIWLSVRVFPVSVGSGGGGGVLEREKRKEEDGVSLDKKALKNKGLEGLLEKGSVVLALSSFGRFLKF